MAVNISKDLFRLFGLSGRFGWLTTCSTSMTCVQARSLRLLESGRGAGSSNNLATRQLHSTSQHCLGVPAQDASVPLSPAVRYLVYTHNISNLSQITATGPGHRLLKGDILQYIQEVKDGRPVQPATKTTVQPAAKTDKKKPSQQLAKSVSQGSKQTFTDVPVDSSRVAAAQRVAQHKASTPHTYTSSSCALDRVFEHGYSDHHHLTAFLVKAAALTVQRVPQSNCVWVDGDSRPLPSISVSVLGGSGTVKVGGAAGQSLKSIAKIVQEGLATQDNKSENSSISLYHLEGANIAHFTSIGDPTSSSVLCIGSPHLVLNDQEVPSKRVTVTLTADARLLDYELSCHWLQTFCSIVEAPDTSGLL